MPLVLPPPESLGSLPERLGDLGQFRRRVAVAAELFRFVAVPLAIATVACGLDVAFHLPAAARVLALAGVLTAIGVLYRTGLRRANRLPVSPLAVALDLEDRFPRLNDAVASAVSFLTAEPGDRPGAARFRATAVTRAENVADRHDIDGIAPSGRMWRWFWGSVVVSVGAFVGFASGPTRAAIAAVRLADPYGVHPFPTRTTVTLLDPAGPGTLLARGSPFVARFAVGGEIPDVAVVTVRVGESVVGEEPVQLQADPPADLPPDGYETAFRLDPSRASVSFSFRITAGDADTGWHAVTVAPPPVLVPRGGRPSPQVRLDYPAYTELPPIELPDGAGVVEAVAGTRFTFRAAADRRIVAAELAPQTDLTAHRAAAATAALVDDNSLSAVAATLLADEYARPIPVRVSGPGGTLLDAEFVPPLAGLYALRFADESGLTGVRLMNIETFPDPSPSVVLTRPSPAADPTILLPTASVTVRCRAEDRTFGVRAVALEYRVGGPDGPFRKRPLADLLEAGRWLPAVAGPTPVTRPKPVGLDAGVTVPVAAFVSPTGTPPADGDTITLRAVATDWDDVAWTKPPGVSEEIVLRVMAPSSVEAMAQKELAGMRPELLRLREDQRAARRTVEAVADAAKSGELRPEHPGQLAQAEEAQRQIRNAVGDPDSGLRANADRVRQTVRANGLPKSPTTDRLDAVADDLGRLADQPLNAADPPLAAARQLAADPMTPPTAAELAGLLGRAKSHQEAAEAGFEAVLERLEQWAGAGEVRGEARAMKEQLQAAGAAADRARPPTGVEPKPSENAARNGAADEFDRLADRASGVVGKAARLAVEQDRKATDLRAAADTKGQEAAEVGEQAKEQPPGSAAAADLNSRAAGLAADADDLRRAADRTAAEAAALRESLDAAGGQALPRDLRDAAAALRNNQPDRAAAARRSAGDRLDRLTDGLTERSNPAATDLPQDRAAAADELEKLGEAQDELRKKARDAAAIPDPAERADALKNLAAEQERLQRRAEIVAQKLTRDRTDPTAADAARKAADAMAAARDQLDQGQPPAEPQDDALDRLDEALDTIETEQQQAENHLSREKQQELAARVRSFRDRQQAAVAEADRLQSAADGVQRWDRPLIASLADLEDRERTLAEELRGFVTDQLADAPVFGRLAGRAADGMDRAADLAGERRDDILTADPDDPFDPDLETASAARVRRPMGVALRRLDQVLSAVAPESMEPAPMAPADPPPDGPKPAPDAAPPEGAGAGGESPDVAAALAQLKALRELQAEVNERTAAFAQTHPGDKKLTDDDLYELKEIEQTQRDVAELFDQIAETFRPTPEVP